MTVLAINYFQDQNVWGGGVGRWG